MYTNQDCDVQWDDAHSNMFKIFNGVEQGSVISPLLFTLYIDSLFLLLKQLGRGCHRRYIWLRRSYCSSSTFSLLFKKMISIIIYIHHKL